MNNSPIGVFDSGLGGLTVARAIIDQLPHESITYIGDTAHTPYGSQPIALVRELALSVMDDLVDSGVKMLVIACNTASAAVLRDARERYTLGRGIPVVEVIQPAVRHAVQATRNGKIGVIGTQATISSGAYRDAFAAAPHLELTMQACPRFVEFVENGVTDGPELLAVARQYLEPVREAGVDTLVLGCTHYPLLTGVIHYVMGDGVTLVSSAAQTAQDVYSVLLDGGLARERSQGDPVYSFYATGDVESFGKLARRFLGPEVSVARRESDLVHKDVADKGQADANLANSTHGSLPKDVNDGRVSGNLANKDLASSDLTKGGERP
ncbi:MAG: glutamate racemase [Actinomycetaceae bacterium]|nr:glutamate racemase [Actinomycetaceae bacterium]MDY5853964.1 glutamate racemase [Arcanobacterium sp.]